MKRYISILTAMVFSFTLLFGSSPLSAAPELPKDQNIEITLLTPPVICEAVSFPVVAKVINNKSDEAVQLKTAVWKWDQKEYKNELKETIKPGGNSVQKLNKYKAKEGTLTADEQQDLKVQYEKMKEATSYIRFTVTEEMAEEIMTKGSVKLTLDLSGENLSDKKEIKSLQEIILNAGRMPEKPPVAPGAHHSDWYYGDTHSHSNYTWDYFFGDGIYTIPELKSLAKVAGLEWLVLTDHAYCLDANEYNTQKNTVTSLSDSSFAFLYGEELSAAELVKGKKSYDTCHFNGILNSSFVPCKTDIFRKASSPNSQQAINYLKQYNGLVTINHPNWGTGSTESWNFNINTYPYTHGETGMEIMNGSWSDLNNGSTTRWIDRRLLKGEKVFPFAGSDTESSNHFGECYTVVYGDYLTQSNIKSNLAQGHQYVTTHPGLSMWARKSGTSTWSWMGDTLTMGTGNAEVYVSYADSYNSMDIVVMKGKTGWTAEQQVYTTTVSAGSGSFTITAGLEPGSYLRVYCIEKGNSSYRAYTAPIWFN